MKSPVKDREPYEGAGGAESILARRSAPWPSRSLWRRFDMVMVAAVGVVLLAGVVRMLAFRTAFDVNNDEVYYSVLGVSLGHGVFPPRFAGHPFLLHPPLFFAASTVFERVLPPGPTLLDLVMRVRELNIVSSALTAGVIFWIARRLADWRAGLLAALLFVADPYLSQIGGRALLEPTTWFFGLLGWALLLRVFEGRGGWVRATAGGLLLGLSMVDKDIAVVVTIVPLVIALWLRWADRRLLAYAGLASLAPTGAYLIAVTASGGMGAWLSQETMGVRRMLGIVKITGFGEGGHPSVVSAMLRQAPLYGWSYLVCGLGLLAALYLVLRARVPAVRVVGLVALCGAATLAYAALFGTLETQMFYFPAVPALIAFSVYLAQFVQRGDRRMAVVAVSCVLALVLLGEGAVQTELRAAPDNGTARLLNWFQQHDRTRRAVIADDTDVPQLVLARYGFRTVAAAAPAVARSEHVRYLTLFSISDTGRYSTLSAAQSAWYRAHGTLVYRFSERSYGVVSVYRTDSSARW